jgi:hypothetical protein
MKAFFFDISAIGKLTQYVVAAFIFLIGNNLQIGGGLD